MLDVVYCGKGRRNCTRTSVANLGKSKLKHKRQMAGLCICGWFAGDEIEELDPPIAQPEERLERHIAACGRRT